MPGKDSERSCSLNMDKHNNTEHRICKTDWKCQQSVWRKGECSEGPDRSGEKEKDHDICHSLYMICMERAKGIEPSSKAWEAFVLPMNYARRNESILTGKQYFVKRKDGRADFFPYCGKGWSGPFYLV